MIDLNVQGTWLMTHAAATKAFIPQGGGKVLSVTLSPHNGMPGMVHSGAARAAVENMMRTLAVEWARFGIKLCALAAGLPGSFEHEQLDIRDGAETGQLQRRLAAEAAAGSGDHADPPVEQTIAKHVRMRAFSHSRAQAYRRPTRR